MSLNWQWQDDSGVWSAHATDGGPIHAVIVSTAGLWRWAVWHLNYRGQGAHRRGNRPIHSGRRPLDLTRLARQRDAGNPMHFL